MTFEFHFPTIEDHKVIGVKLTFRFQFENELR